MRLSDCFIELVAYVAYFTKTVANKQPPFEQVKADIQRLCAESQQCLERENVNPEDFDQARFAIFAWVDETILNSAWKQKNRWMGEQLQRIYYNTSDAGELFFERLNNLGLHQRDVREVYYLCLALGFKGRYCHEGDDFLLEQLKSSNLKLLMGSSAGIPSLDSGELFPEAYTAQAVGTEPSRYKFRMPGITLLSLGFPAILYIVLYLVYRFILSNVGANLLKTVP
jgi:type VI secretion system protein ImpK